MKIVKSAKLLSVISFFLVTSSLQSQWKEVTNLTQKEAFLIKFKSVFKDIKEGESWQDYKSRLINTAKVPGQLGPGARGRDAFHILDLRFVEEYVALQGPNDLGIFYMLKFHPDEITVNGKKVSTLKGFELTSAFSAINEFDKRRLQKQGQQRIWDDLKKLKLPKSVHLTFSGSLMPYDFDKESFELRSFFSQFFGLKEEISRVQIPLTLNEDFRTQYPESYELKIAPDKAEVLRSKLKPGIAGSPEVTSKLWLTINENLRTNPTYLDTGTGYSMYGIYHPNEYRLDSIEFFLTQNGKVLEKIFATDKLVQPKGTKSTGKKGASNSATVTGTTDYQLSFLRLNAGNRSQPFVQYSGTASNLPNSLHEVGTIQLRLLYQNYQDSQNNALRTVRGATMEVVGNIYFQLQDKGKKVAWQYVGRFETTDKGFRIHTGSDATAKFMKKFGYKDGYFDVIFNDDPSVHSVALLFFEGGQLQFSATLDPLHKTVKPPFTN